MRRLLYRLIRALHGWCARMYLIRTDKPGEVMLHNLSGTWMGSARLIGSRWNDQTRTADPLPEPIWQALVFAKDETVTEEGFSDLEATTRALYRLVKTRLGDPGIVSK